MERRPIGRLQAARKLEFTIIQDDRDPNIPTVELSNGAMVYGGDDDGNAIFIGKIFEIEKDRAKSEVKVTAYDYLFILNKSKTSRKYSGALPEDIAVEICNEMGIKAGNIAKTGVQVSFIANNRTGYQIIMGAYTEAHKQNEKQYQCIMNGEVLDVIEKGELCGAVLDSSVNMTDSIYKESIEDIVNRVLVVDDSGNSVDKVDDEESQKDYGIVIQGVYKQTKDKDDAEGAKDVFKKVDREGSITALGDYRCKSGYSLIIQDTNFKGKFWIVADSHEFKNGQHTMRLRLEWENIMAEETSMEKPKS